MTRLSCIALFIALALACVLAQELYSDRYDDVDVKSVFANEKLRLQYYRCLVDKGPCSTAIQKFFKGKDVSIGYIFVASVFFVADFLIHQTCSRFSLRDSIEASNRNRND